MKKFLSLFVMIALCGLIMQSCNKNAKVTLTNQADSVNYAYGVYLGDEYLKDFKSLPEMNKKAYVKAFKSVMDEDGKPIMSADSAANIVRNFVQKYRQAQMAAQASGDTSASARNSKMVPGTDYNVDSVSNGLACYIAYSLKDGFKDLPCGFNQKIFEAGFIEAFNETGKTIISKDDASKLVDNYAAKLQADEQAKSSAGNQEFLDQNKAKEGVVVTEDGLQYRIITAGKGKKPTANNTVKVNYTGKLIDGTVFDSSEKSGKPAEFAVNQVIPGWTEALQMMPVGSKWEIVIPPELGYGANGSGSIPPNSVLIFEVELLDIVQ